MSNKKPIFIHSLFRSGSTYLFNVFRRSPSGYWCYQEPLNEHLLCAATKPDMLLEINKEMQKYLRHPKLEKPYFYEFYTIANEVGRFFRKEFSYEQYFTTENEDIVKLKNYFTVLLNEAPGRAVFQCCRTVGRVTLLKSGCDGKHIFLWRNPWDQWWSYKKDYYFYSRNLLIFNAKNLPEFLLVLKKELNFPDFHDANIFTEYDFFNRHWLDATGSYKLFYALWCHAMLEAKPHCDLSISIDQLTTSNIYRNRILVRLEKMGIEGLDLSDCSIPMASYGGSDGDFFLKIEDYIHELLLSHGYSHAQVNELKILSEDRKDLLVDVHTPENSAVRDAMRVREYLLKAETELAEGQRLLFDTQIRANQADERIAVLRQEMNQLSNTLHGVYGSKSWRITKPLRWVDNYIRLLKQKL